MNHNKTLFKFPTFLPNDLEGFIFVYPKKFPELVSYYEKAAERYFEDPAGFEIFAKNSFKDLHFGFEKINNAYQKGDKNSLEFLLSIDGRLHKLYAFRFWVVNYLFADGPLHEYYVDKIKFYSRRLVDINGIEVEEYERKIMEIQRDLMQSDYADLYLQSAFNGVNLMKVLRKDKKLSAIIKKIKPLVEKNEKKNNLYVYKNLDYIVEKLLKKGYDFGEVMIQVAFRKTKLPLYHMMMHSIEFEKENIELEKRHNELTKKIESILDNSRKKLSVKEMKELRISYRMARILAKSKDIMGNIDPVLLPLWFEVLERIGKILQDAKTGYKKRPIGPGALYYAFVWHLPDEFKIKAFKPDNIPFNIKNC